MKRRMAPTTLVIVFATVFVLGMAPRAQADELKQCSDASLRGSFGFTSIGTLLALRPRWLARSVKSGGRRSTGEAIRTQRRR